MIYNDLFKGVEIKCFLWNFKKNCLIKLIKGGVNLDLCITIDFNYEKEFRGNYKIISAINWRMF